MKPIRIAVSGASGRMGRELILGSYCTGDIKLGAAFGRLGSSALGIDTGELVGLLKNGVVVSADFCQQRENFDVLIDFTQPEATLHYLDLCRQYNKPMVIGTTGLRVSDRKKIEAASVDIAIMVASNFSIGIAILLKIVKKVAVVMGQRADIELIEAHHKFKMDIPSGTALEIAAVIGSVSQRDLSSRSPLSECGTFDLGRISDSSIGLTSIREGDIVGEHTVFFSCENEQLSISHRISDRMVFAKGAMRAASWLANQSAGLYGMSDLLGLNDE